MAVTRSPVHEQLRMLARAAADANASPTVEGVAQSIADHARGLLEARAAVAAIRPSRTRSEARRVSIAAGPPPAASLEDDPTLAPVGVRRTADSLTAALCSRDGSVFGFLRVLDKAEGAFSETDELLLLQLAAVGAMAIENVVLAEAAQATRKGRDDIMSVLSHDLRNPLNTIMLSAEILTRRQGEKAADPVPIALRMRRSAERMNTLISELVDVTRIEANSLRIETHTQSVQTLVDEVLDSFRVPAAEKSLALNNTVAAGIAVQADRERIHQVLSNLVGNSVKFTAVGEVTVGAEPREDGTLVFVSDSGVGIAPEKMATLFSQSWQSQGKTRQGSGLGLFIAKGIVEAHGGRMWAESTAGSTTVFFVLPSAKAA